HPASSGPFPGRLLEPEGDFGPRGMIAIPSRGNRIRLTGPLGAFLRLQSSRFKVGRNQLSSDRRSSNGCTLAFGQRCLRPRVCVTADAVGVPYCRESAFGGRGRWTAGLLPWVCRWSSARILNLELLKPPRLKPGATIGVAAVSGPVAEEKL